MLLSMYIKGSNKGREMQTTINKQPSKWTSV